MSEIPVKTNVDTNCAHFFCYDTSKNPSEFNYEYGNFQLTDKKLLKNKPNIPKESWLDSIQQTIADLPDDRNGWLIYIHGFQGDNIFFMQQSGYIIQNEIFNNPTHPYGLALSLQWSSVLNYDQAVENAYEKGRNFASVIDDVYRKLKKKDTSAPVSILCHSMGNKVWQGLYAEWTKLNPDLHLDNVMMFAADLESEVFETSFIDLPVKADRVFVFYGNEDKTLRMAKVFKNHERLGIVGPANRELLPPNIIGRDMTAIDDDQTFTGNITLHRYYYGSPTVRKEIVEILGR